jgi:hypothetical protein
MARKIAKSHTRPIDGSIRYKIQQLRSKSLQQEKTYARFYGRYEDMKHRHLGYEYQVRVSDRLSGKAMHKLIATVCTKMKYDHLMPIHRKGQAFSSFRELFRSPWARIRRLEFSTVKS